MTDVKTTALAKPMPIEIHVGVTYLVVAGDQIKKAKIEKIYKDGNDTYIVVTIKTPGKWIGRNPTTLIPAAEFKRRMILGGINHIEI